MTRKLGLLALLLLAGVAHGFTFTGSSSSGQSFLAADHQAIETRLDAMDDCASSEFLKGAGANTAPGCAGVVDGDVPAGVTRDSEATTRCESFTILDPADADDHFFRKAKHAETVTSIDCLAEGGGTIALTLQECSSTGGSCGTTEAAITCDSDGAAHASGIDDAAIDAGDWQRALYGAPSGTVNALTFTVCATGAVVR